MARFGFCAGFYTLSSVNADCQACINRVPEKDESGMGVSDVLLLPSPGLRVFTTLPESPLRGLRTVNYLNRSFAVAGAGFYEVFADGTHQKWAVLNDGINDNSQVTMVENSAKQLMICAQGVLYVFKMDTNELVAATADLGPYGIVDFIDGYFMAIIANSQRAQFSSLEDGLTWDDLDVIQISVFTDNIVGMLVDHREVWFWGATRSIAYVDTGDPDTPFQPTPSSAIEHGMAAAFSSVRLDNTVFWIGQSEQGVATAVRLQGYIPTRVSTHAIEDKWQKYATVADAISYSYQEGGHAFWVIYFPSANATWVYDVSTGAWHERYFWENGAYIAHRSRCHTLFNGKHLVGDWKSGNIYQMSWAFNDDFGNVIRRVRRAPHVTTEQQVVRHRQMQILIESGLQADPPINDKVQPDGLPTLILADPDGNNWRITIDDSGILHSTEGRWDDVPQIIVFQTGAALWQLGANSIGELTTVSVADLSQPRYGQLTFLTSGRLLWQLQVQVDGLLKTFGPIAPAGREPLIALRWSDDGGHTWSNEHFAGTGAVGEYRKRVIWRALGRSRDRVYEAVDSDPIPSRIIDAYLIASPGSGPTSRLSENIRKSA
jgi:hypothetical protein